MNRIFTVFALFAIGFMLAAMFIGLSIGELTPDASESTRRLGTMHRLSGIAASLVVVLVNSVVVTYFIGTSRWCREVVETYRLDARLLRRSTSLKRGTFPIATLSMLAVVGVVALGGAADPAAALQLKPLGGLTWSSLHFYGALLGTAFIAYSFVMEWINIQAHREVIAEILAEVHRIRVEKGLEV